MAVECVEVYALAGSGIKIFTCCAGESLEAVSKCHIGGLQIIFWLHLI